MSVEIGKGKPLYKGDNNKYLQQYLPEKTVTLKRGPAFFAFKPGDAEQYGVVFKFTTTERLTVVDLDSKTGLKQLYESSPPNIQKILKSNYGYHYESNKIGIRDSSHAADRTLSEYICGLGFDGYILRNAKTDGEGSFHKELMLCDMKKVKYSGIVTHPEKINEEDIRKKMREDEISKRLKGEREEKKKRRSSSRRTSPEHLIFPGNLGFHSPAMSIAHSATTSPLRSMSLGSRPLEPLFSTPTKKSGGKKSKKNRKNKLRKTIRLLVSRFAETKDVNPKSLRHTVEVVDRSRMN